jgi:hypothetical protein
VTRVDTTVTNNVYYNLLVNDTLDMNPDPLQSQNIVWTGSLTRKWVLGDSTNDRSDDVFSVSGSAKLTRPNGHVFTAAISTPLQFSIGCDFAQSGVINVTGYDGLRVLNYGTGNCDNAAQLNIAQHVYQLTLTK